MIKIGFQHLSFYIQSVKKKNNLAINIRAKGHVIQILIKEATQR